MRTQGRFSLFPGVARDMKDSSENPWVRIASSVLGFITLILIEAEHAGSDAYPGAIFIVSGRRPGHEGLLRKSLGTHRFQRAWLHYSDIDRSRARWKRCVPRGD